jgi:hypothetical protein
VNGDLLVLRASWPSVPVLWTCRAGCSIVGSSHLRLFLRVERRPDLRGLRSPTWDYSLMHTRAGNLVDAYDHRLSRFSPGRTVLNEILGDLVEPLVGRDDLVVLA